MIKSMTGYGRGEWEGDGKRVEVEVKSFNHRYCDIIPHLPRRLNSLEGQVRSLIKQRVARGRIEVSVQIDNASQAEQKLELDVNLARDIHLALKTLQGNLGIPGEIRLETLASFKEIFSRKEVETNLEKEWAALHAALETALNGLEKMRGEEGSMLRQDFLNRLKAVEEIITGVEEKTPVALSAYRDRLAQRVQELSGGLKIDEARLAQEVAYLAERSDINEELVRIRSHINQLREMLDRPEPMGRKMEFILQEINREANTIGSKANDAGIAQMAVEIKSELEKMRQQVQNVE
ncbi:MAG: YicC/YloC family endoribonuclease [Thermodesulfobacteriota bacterium]|nr:YicC/YloC family endoribonuclease [Thermodesulfobacteriota bacterium]